MANRIVHSKPTISKDERAEVLSAIVSGYVGNGNRVTQVNSWFSDFFKKEMSFFVNSGTSAFFLALKALGVEENDEVIIPNYLCGSLYSQIIRLRAIPVVIDTLLNSFFVSPETIRKAITNRTKAILINHPFGHFEPAIFELSFTKIPIIEDVTHSLNARHGTIMAGTIGDISIVSFGSTKFLTSGTGGIVSFSKKINFKKIEMLLDHDYYTFPASEGVVRYNYSMGDLNAAFLLGQINHLESFVNRRIDIAKQYYNKLKVPLYPSKYLDGSVYFRFFVNCKPQKNRLLNNKLHSENIDSIIGGVSLINKTFSLSDKYLNSEAFWTELLSIPIYPSLKNQEINLVINTINSLL